VRRVSPPTRRHWRALSAPGRVPAQAATVCLESGRHRAVRHDGQRQLLPGFLPGDTQRLLASSAGRGGTGATATATFNLSLSHPVVDSDGKRLGVVIVEQSMPQLQALFDTLPLPDAAAYAELQQNQTGDASVVLMRRGNQAIKRHAQPTPIALAGTPWQIAVWRPVTPVVESVVPYVLGWLVASLIIAILVMATILAVRNRVSDNLRMLVKFTTTCASRPAYPLSGQPGGIQSARTCRSLAG